MVNHFASLLGNINMLSFYNEETGNFLANAEFGALITSGASLISLDNYTSSVGINAAPSVFMNRNYAQLTLPPSLQRFYDILFPPASSAFYREFLLFCYLRVVAASDRNVDTLIYDKRVTYALNEVSTYFRFNKLTELTSSDNTFKILLTGKAVVQEDIRDVSNTFTIHQDGDSNNVWVYSNTQDKYYKRGVPASTQTSGMLIPLAQSPGHPDTTLPVLVGDTGVSFTLTGPFSATAPATNFSTTPNKTWKFSVEAPFKFDFTSKFQEISNSYAVLENMLNFEKDSCNSAYENIWHMHYNSVYRLAGLLLAYVERVNLVWLNKAA